MANVRTVSRSGLGAATSRFVGFAVLTFAAGAIGRMTFAEDLGLSLVWPLYGVGSVWLASASRTSLPWDTAALGAIAALAILVSDGGWQQALMGVVMALLSASTWVVVMREWGGDLYGAGGDRPIGRLSDVGVVLAASVTSAVLTALARGTGLGLVPSLPVDEVLLTILRNLSWILAISAAGLLVIPQRDLALRRWWTAVDRPGLRLLESALTLTAVVILTLALFSDTPPPLAFPLVLGAVWAAFRLPSPVAVCLAIGLGAYAVFATLDGRGPFAAATPYTSAAIAQAFLITLVLTSLAIACTLEERRETAVRATRAEHEAESRAAMFSAVIEHLAEGVSVIDADDTYSVRNPAAHGMTGRAGLLHPDTDDPEQPVMVSASGEPVSLYDLPHARARRGEEVIREMVRVRTLQGTERQLEVTSVAVRVHDEAPMVVNTLRDVTSEHQERDQLVAFAGVVAHDLKNPLTVIRGWSESIQEELAADGPPDVRALRSMVARVQSASDQMTAFIEDLLDITVARDRPLDLEPLDLSALAGEVAELRRAGDTQARIAVQPGMAVMGDRFLVRQLFDNLIGNAVKYVAPGVRPTVSVQAVAVEGELEVSITDNGVGIPVEARLGVFDSFVRAHGSAYSGTGLGLAICARVVNRHGGRIWVAEHEDPGTRISFTLPLR